MEGIVTEKFPWSTHQELLVACVCASTGTVIEIGCGHYSTPILHHICKAAGRLLVSCDHDQKWLDEFRYLEGDNHHFVIPTTDWENLKLIDEEKLGCALVDHNPGSRYVPEINRLRGHTEFIVAHDAEPSKKLGVVEVAQTFKHHYVDKRHSCWTVAMSDFEKIPV